MDVQRILIKKVHAREVLDSRGDPTIEAEVHVNGAIGSAIAPSGKSVSSHALSEIRDCTKAYSGRGVLKVVTTINTIVSKKLKGKNAADQSRIDELLLSLNGKNRLGTHAITAISMATCRAVAAHEKLELYEYLLTLTNRKPTLPIPFAKLVSGGAHAPVGLPIQEINIAPVGARTFSEAVQYVAEVYGAFRTKISAKNPRATLTADEGGFVPNAENIEQTLHLVTDSIKKAGYKNKVMLSIDAAANNFYKKDEYHLGVPLRPDQLLRFWLTLAKEFPIISLEDPFAEDDYLSWHLLMHDLGKKVHMQVVSDDLTATRKDRVQRAINERLCNTLLVKVNQVGTVTAAIESALLAFENGWNVMVSHRSGETEDTFIADLAVALGCGQIKIGAPCRGERTAKYNRLLQIEEHLGKKSPVCAISPSNCSTIKYKR